MSDLSIDLIGGKVVFSEDFEHLLAVSYIPSQEGGDENIDRLSRYLIWHAWLERKNPAPVCKPGERFVDWMFRLPLATSPVVPQPLLPNVAIAAARAFPYCGGTELLESPEGRYFLLWWLHGNFSVLLHGFAEPQWMLNGFEAARENPFDLPLMLQAYWHFTKGLQEEYPIDHEMGRLAFLDWCARNPRVVFPDGKAPLSLAALLAAPAPQDTGEGLTLGLAARAFHERVELKTPEQRLGYAASQTVKSPGSLTLQGWKALCAPAADEEWPRLPVLATCLPASPNGQPLPGEWKRAHKERLKRLGSFLSLYETVSSEYCLPAWLQEALLAPVPQEEAESWGVTAGMAAWAIGKGQTAAGTWPEFIAWYMRQIPSAPASCLPSGRTLLGWEEKGIRLPETPFFAARKRASCSVIGWPDGALGLGEDSRMLYKALRTKGIDVRLVTVSDRVPYFGLPWRETPPLDKEPAGRFLLFSLAAQDIYKVRQFFPSDWWRGRYAIGICPWELPRWPDEAKYCLDALDEIWAPSTFVARAFAETGKPVSWVPPAVDQPKAAGDWRGRLGIGRDTLVFMTSFDSHASYLRKNPLAVLGAFNKAFARKKKDVKLIIKTINADAHEKEWLELHRQNTCGEDVIFLNSWLSPQENVDLLNTCDVFVSLHRSEGFGRLLAEAMLLGKLLVASDFGGSRDFALPSTACPISGRLVPVANDGYLFGKGQVWFDASEEEAAEVLNDIAENFMKYAAIREAGRSLIESRYSVQSVGDAALRNLEQKGFINPCKL